ncbi:MAG: serine hydrolase [Verrucomicrobiae bacterium]|nr:serine hydrolase [Verrucomicrobiae bacterium]
MRGVIAIALLAATVHAAPLTNAIAAARAEVGQKLATNAPGFSIAVGREKKILWAEGFGFADVARHKPVTPQTQFRIGSVSKPLTAAGLMRLVELDKIDLDADIHKYVPDFPDKGAVITTRELAGHLAGFRHYRGTEAYANTHYNSLRAGLKIFEDDPLLFKPGEKFSYSSYGFNLISVVMESAAREKYADWMRQAVFEPLQMTNTVPDPATPEPPGCTCFYELDASKTHFVIAPPVDNGFKLASGGYLSTPKDLVRFGFAMLHAGLLKQASLDTLFTSQKTAGGQSTGYGIGWSIRHDLQGHRVWSHNGGAIGGSAVLAIYPDSGVVIAMTANSMGGLDQAGNSIRLIADEFTAP